MKEKTFKIDETFEILKNLGLVQNRRTLQRWIADGILPATKKKGGHTKAYYWEIKQDVLDEFISLKNPYFKKYKDLQQNIREEIESAKVTGSYKESLEKIEFIINEMNRGK